MLCFRPRILACSIVGAFFATGLLAATAVAAFAWRTEHGSPDNSNSVDVRTAPAVKPAVSLRLDGIAPGVAPVIAPSGMLYLGDERGNLMSFTADGAPGWTRSLGGFQSIRAAPAVGSDGSVYVIGSATLRDNRTNPPTVRQVAELHRFTAGGGALWRVPLVDAADGVISSSPNILRMGGSDVVLVATGRKQDGFRAFLTAFSAETGAVLAHQEASKFTSPEVSGGADWGALWPDTLSCILGCFSTTLEPVPAEQRLPKNLERPFPAPALYASTDSGNPRVFVSDRFHDLVGYSFSGSAFAELFRVRDNRQYLTSPPLVWPNGPVMIGAAGPKVGSGVTLVSLSPGYTGGPVTTHRVKTPRTAAAPTALGDSRFALVQFNGGVTFMNGAAVQKEISLPGQSIAAAAASRNHVFVSTVTGLYTINKATMAKVGEFAWTKGGTSQPVIGPQGHVYAIARNTLYVFPPSRLPDIPDVGTLPDITATNPSPLPPPAGGGSVLADAGTQNPQTLPAIQPAETQSLLEIQQDLPSKTYTPPLTRSGNRLFACLNLDGDDCGNAHHREVAQAFCRMEGFERAIDLDVDSRRGTAETLEGQHCSKKKCKVFDRIVCRK